MNTPTPGFRELVDLLYGPGSSAPEMHLVYRSAIEKIQCLCQSLGRKTEECDRLHEELVGLRPKAPKFKVNQVVGIISNPWIVHKITVVNQCHGIYEYFFASGGFAKEADLRALTDEEQGHWTPVGTIPGNTKQQALWNYTSQFP